MSKSKKITIFAKPKIGLKTYLNSTKSKKRKQSNNFYTKKHIAKFKLAHKKISSQLSEKARQVEDNLVILYENLHDSIYGQDSLLSMLEAVKLPKMNVSKLIKKKKVSTRVGKRESQVRLGRNRIRFGIITVLQARFRKAIHTHPNTRKQTRIYHRSLLQKRIKKKS